MKERNDQNETSESLPASNDSVSNDQKKYLVTAEDLTELTNLRIKKVVREMLAKYLAIAGLIISVLGYFGIKNMKESLQVSVHEEIYTDIKKETETLENRTKERLEHNQNLFETKATYIELGINETKNDLKSQSRYVQDEMFESILTMRDVERNAYATAYMLDTIRYYYITAGKKNLEYEQRLSKVYDKFGTVDSLLYRFNSGLENQKNQLSRIEENITFPKIHSVHKDSNDVFIIKGINFGAEKSQILIRQWRSNTYENYYDLPNDVVYWSDSLVQFLSEDFTLENNVDSVGTRITINNGGVAGTISFGRIPSLNYSSNYKKPLFRKAYKFGGGRIGTRKRRNIF